VKEKHEITTTKEKEGSGNMQQDLSQVKSSQIYPMQMDIGFGV